MPGVPDVLHGTRVDGRTYRSQTATTRGLICCIGWVARRYSPDSTHLPEQSRVLRPVVSMLKVDQLATGAARFGRPESASTPGQDGASRVALTDKPAKVKALDQHSFAHWSRKCRAGQFARRVGSGSGSRLNVWSACCGHCDQNCQADVTNHEVIPETSVFLMK
jgi:hypothetical protein